MITKRRLRQSEQSKTCKTHDCHRICVVGFDQHHCRKQKRSNLKWRDKRYPVSHSAVARAVPGPKKATPTDQRKVPVILGVFLAFGIRS